MTDSVICLDTDVMIKFLIVEQPVELSEAATRLVHRAIVHSRLVAPAFAWAEVGSVLRKKVRQHQITQIEAETFWIDYRNLPIQFLDSIVLRSRTWVVAQQFGLPALYDAAFLACAEVALAPVGGIREFWTADRALVRALEVNRPSYVRLLEEDSQ